MIDTSHITELPYYDPSLFKYFSHIESICLFVVRQSGFGIMMIPDPIESVCLAAVNQNGYVIEYIDNPSEAVCLAAVNQNSYAVQYIESPTEEVCLAAVKQNGNSIKWIDNPSYTMLRIAAEDIFVREHLNPMWPHYEALKRLI